MWRCHTKGTQYSFAEQYFMGIWSATINHTVFVLTDVRLLMFRTNGKGRPKKTYWMVYYSQIDRFDSSWTRSLKLKLADGRKLQFTGFPSADRRIMPDIFREALECYRAAGFDPESSQSLENLCTHCFDAIPKAQHDCEKCGAVYWRPSELAWRSLIFPSWGDWLMGHTTVAVVELIGTGIAWLLIILTIIEAINTNEPGLFVVALFIFVATHGIDAAITAHIARKGLHPKSGPEGSYPP